MRPLFVVKYIFSLPTIKPSGLILDLLFFLKISNTSVILIIFPFLLSRTIRKPSCEIVKTSSLITVGFNVEFILWDQFKIPDFISREKKRLVLLENTIEFESDTISEVFNKK